MLIAGSERILTPALTVYPQIVDDNIAATTIKLNDDELAALGKVSALPPEYPGWMMAFQGENRRKQLAESVDA